MNASHSELERIDRSWNELNKLIAGIDSTDGGASDEHAGWIRELLAKRA